jgi:hypothetical protein
MNRLISSLLSAIISTLLLWIFMDTDNDSFLLSFVLLFLFQFIIYVIIGIPVSLIIDSISNQQKMNYITSLVLYIIVAFIFPLFLTKFIFTWESFIYLGVIPVLTFFHVLYLIEKQCLFNINDNNTTY